MTVNFAFVWPAIAAAFLASLVEAVEALTIVLAVAIVRGWRPAGPGVGSQQSGSATCSRRGGSFPISR